MLSTSHAIGTAVEKMRLQKELNLLYMRLY